MQQITPCTTDGFVWTYFIVSQTIQKHRQSTAYDDAQILQLSIKFENLVDVHVAT